MRGLSVKDQAGWTAKDAGKKSDGRQSECSKDEVAAFCGTKAG